MDLSTLKQLKDLGKRLQQRGFSWHHDDYFCLREALPELIERHLSEASTRPDGTETCYICGETEGYHEKYCSRGNKSRG